MRLKHATGETILIRELSPERLSKGGIIIPETAQDEYARYGVIEAVGPRVEDPDLQPGVTVVYSRYHGKTRVDGVELNIVSEGDVYLLVEDAPLDPPIPTSKVLEALDAAYCLYHGRDAVDDVKRTLGLRDE